MRTPISPNPTAADHTLKIHPPATGAGEALSATDRLSVESTPLPPRPDPDFPRVRGYELISVVGCGGMGIVYEARHRELNRRVAIKTLRGEALADSEYRDRFRAEAEAIARLQHPNIIQVFEIGMVEALPFETHPSPFIALEFVDGSLSRHTRAPQQPRSAARIVETLARAAHAAHLLGIIHRDLKPANVLLTREGDPKIADFGIAKQLGVAASGTDRTVTRAGTIMGTPEYMAPEQFDGGEATSAIDIYALGVILYELLTARVPFQGATFSDTMMLALRQEPVPPRRLQPGVPRDLETICLKCLEKDPEKRYESAEALADDLAAWAEGRTIRARAAGPAERTMRWARRNPAVAVLSVAVFLAALIGLTGVVWGWTEARRSAAEAETNANTAKLAEGDAHESARKERWEHYRASVFAASSALRLHDTNAARRALDDAPTEHRDWVWNQLYAQLDRSREALQAHTGALRDARFTPDGRCVLLVAEDGALRVWNLLARTDTGVIDLPRNVRAPTLSDDGSTLVYGDPDHVVHLRDLATGRSRITLRGHTDAVHCVQFAEGNRLITAAADRTVRVWDARDGREIHQFQPPPEATGPLLISPNGRLIAVRGVTGYSTRIWNLETKREVVFEDRAHNSLLARFSPNSELFVTVCSFPDTTIRLWDVSTGKLLATMQGHTNQVTHILFSADSSRIVTTSMDRSVRVWDARPEPTGRESEALVTLRGHTGWVDHAAFSPDGSRVVSSSHDRTVRYWDTKTGEQLAVLCGHTAEVRVAAFQTDAPVLVSASVDGTLRFWDVPELDRGYAIRGHKQFAYSVGFFPDGKRAVSSGWDGTARIWDATTSRQLKVLDHGDDSFVASVAVHPEGRLFATLSRGRRQTFASLRLWDADTGVTLHHWTIPSGWQDGRLAFDPTGQFIAAGCADFRVRVFDIQTKALVATLEGHTAPVRDVAFSPDGRWLASAGDDGDHTVHIWDMQTKKVVQVLHGQSRGVYTVAWNREGTMLASGSLDGSVWLWNTTTWEPVGKLKNGAWVYSVAFTPDSNLLAVACRDNLIRVWDVRMQQELAELSGHQDYVHHLAFSPDGSRLISASGDRTLRVWDTLPKAERAKK